MEKKRIRVGVFGVGPRGNGLARNFMMLDCDVVAICGARKAQRDETVKFLGEDVAVYEDFDSFIEHDMDAVILSNFFHEHAPYAIKCLERGIHVFSECISNSTMAEGVALIRAAEKSSAIYMLAENYPQMKFNREMKRICDGKTLGKILYAEGEYNHPIDDENDSEFSRMYMYYPDHWRNHLPGSYYVTHSLGPIMRATGATPKKVSAFAIYAPLGDNIPTATQNGDASTVMITQNDDDSVFKFVGWGRFGAHGNSYRICGKNGQIENLRGMGEKVMLRYNDWSIPEGGVETSLYEPAWNEPAEEVAHMSKSAHGGSDYLTARMFIECIREGKQPEHPFDVHSAVAMSSVAILAHRSVLEGKAFDIPDFRKEECRKQYENDRATPFVGTDGSRPTIPCCSHPDYKPSERQLKLYEEMLKADK